MNRKVFLFFIQFNILSVTLTFLYINTSKNINHELKFQL